MPFSSFRSGSSTRRNRKQRQLEAEQRRSRAKLAFELLEPRVLLSADPLTVALAGNSSHPLSHNIVLEEVTQPAINIDHPLVTMIEVVEQSATPEILASANARNVSAVDITGGVGNVRLTVDTASFGGHVAPSIDFSGGQGTNSLVVSGSTTTNFSITGANSGSVSGPATIDFTGVSNLTGGTGASVFTVEQGGSLSGALDGGPGVDGTLVFDHYNANNAIFTGTGPHSGSVALDGATFKYADLAPIIYTGSAAHVAIDGAGQLVIGDAGTPGQIKISSLNNSMENITFSTPTNALAVNLTTGADSLVIDTLHLNGASLTATGVGADSIDVGAGALVSTRQTSDDTLLSTSFGKSGALALSAATVTIDAGATLYTNANNGYAAGGISLDAVATGGPGNAAVANLAIHGAQIVGGSIAIDATAAANGAVTQQHSASLSLDAYAYTSIDGDNFIASTVGATEIGASVTINGRVDAEAAHGGALNADAAVALANVQSIAVVNVQGATLLGAVTTLSVHSNDLTTLTTTADGSAGGASALGGVVAISDVDTQSTATLGAGVSAAANQLTLGANTKSQISTTAIATAGGATANGAAGKGALASGAITPDGAVSTAAAIAGTYLGDTDAAYMDAAAVGATDGLTISADTSRTVATKADATDVTAGSGVGVAVALNAISISTSAEFGANTAVAGNAAIDVNPSGGVDVFGATALSGAGASNVGVAGALAVNQVADFAFGGLGRGANVTMGSGDLDVVVNQTGDADTYATAYLAGDSTRPGVGASVAIAPVQFQAVAGVQSGAVLTITSSDAATTHDATFEVSAARGIDTIADGGVSGGSATAAALALTYAQNLASAEVDLDAAVTVHGSVTFSATQSSTDNTSATAEAGANATVASLGIVLDTTQALSTGQIQAFDNVSLEANGVTDSTTLATGGQHGASASGPAAATLVASELAYLGNPANVALPTPADADGVFGVAAAMALSVTIGRVSAVVDKADGDPEAIIANDIQLDAAGSVKAKSRANSSAMASAIDGAGIGAALALQTGEADVLAQDNAPISANVISLTATTPVVDGLPMHSGDFRVQAVSGAGTSNVGVAGAMAISGGGIDVQATITDAAASAGSVRLTSNGQDFSTVDASALGVGVAPGVGASFALSVSDATVDASIGASGSLVGDAALTLQANGGQSASTTAEGGAAGGTASGAAMALSVVTDEIDADLDAGSTTNASSVSLSASGGGVTDTHATGGAVGAKTAVGPSLGLGFLVDRVSTDVAGQLTATGTVTMTATDASDQTTEANAGAMGAANNGAAVAALLAQQVAFLQDPDKVVLPAIATADGPLAVAAALSFGYADTAAQADVLGSVTSPSAVDLTATGGSTGGSTASGAAVDNANKGVGVGVAAAVEVATPTLSARIDGSVSTPKLTLTATPNSQTGQRIYSHALSGAGGAETSVAGAFALTIARPVTEAEIGAAGKVANQSGSTTLDASGASDVTANAAAAVLGAGALGVGSSVAVNIAADDTHARIDSGASLSDITSLVLSATGAETSIADATAGATANGAAGAVAVNVAPQDVEADVDPGAALTIDSPSENPTGALTLQATQNQTSVAQASGGISGRDAGFGAAIAVNAPDETTTAALERAATIDGALQVLSNSGGSANATATAGAKGGDTGNSADADISRWLSAAGSDGSVATVVVPSIAETFDNEASNASAPLPVIGAAAALGVNAASSETSSDITVSGEVTVVGAATVQAIGDSGSTANADASQMAGAGAVGLGFAVDYNAHDIDAWIGDGTSLNAGALTVEAMVPQGQAQSSSATAEAGAGAAAGVAGAIALNLINDRTDARILDTAPIFTGSFIQIDAHGDSESSATAGYAAGGLVGGAGVALAANLVVDHAEASVMAGADMTSLGQISIEAFGAQDMTSQAEGVAAAALGAVPSSLTLDVALATTTASIGQGAEIDFGPASANQHQSVAVLADDTTTLNATAGGIGVAGLAGAGVSGQFSDIIKQTEADIDGLVNANGDVEALAYSFEAGLTQADQGAVAGGATAAGSAAAQLGQILTHAAIGSDAKIHANGNVIVNALDMTLMDVSAGGLDAALVASAGAAIGAIGLDKQTEALIDSKATVDAEAKWGATQYLDGLTVSFGSSAPQAGEAPKPLLPDTLTHIFGVILDNPWSSFLTPVQSIPDDPFGSEYRSVTPDVGNAVGIAVAALSHDDLAVQSSGLGAAPVAALQLSASGIAAQSKTYAEIGSGAQINQDRPVNPSGFGSVQVIAIGNSQAMAIGGSLPLSAVAAVGPATSLVALDPDTEAFIGDGAKVSADDGVHVEALHSADVLTDEAGALVSAITAAGSVGGIVLGGRTYAYIGDNASVTAGGSVVVQAYDTAIAQDVAGALALSGALAVGATAGVVATDRDTEAWIGVDANVTAMGEHTDLVQAIDASSAAPGDTPSLTTIEGVSVLADFERAGDEPHRQWRSGRRGVHHRQRRGRHDRRHHQSDGRVRRHGARRAL